MAKGYYGILGIGIGVLCVFGLGSAQYKAAPNFFIKPVAHPLNVLVQESPKPTPSAIPATGLVRLPDVTAARTLRLDGEVGEQSLGLANALLELGKTEEPIYLLINSPGGSVLDGAAILSAIDASNAPVYTVCLQLCASMAAIIFEQGTKRFMVDRAFVMFHPASGGAQGEIDKMASRLGSIQRFVGKMETHIAKRAGIPLEKYKAMAAVELWLDGEDAVAQGFADNVVTMGSDHTYATPISMHNEVETTPTVRRLNLNWVTQWIF